MALKGISILHAVDKARRVRPVVEARINHENEYWVAGSTAAYLVEVKQGRCICTGSWKGLCPGFEHQGVCYHAAAVALHTGLFTEAQEDALRGTVAA